MFHCSFPPWSEATSWVRAGNADQWLHTLICFCAQIITQLHTHVDVRSTDTQFSQWQMIHYNYSTTWVIQVLMLFDLKSLSKYFITKYKKNRISGTWSSGEHMKRFFLFLELLHWSSLDSQSYSFQLPCLSAFLLIDLYVCLCDRERKCTSMTMQIVGVILNIFSRWAFCWGWGSVCCWKLLFFFDN